MPPVALSVRPGPALLCCLTASICFRPAMAARAPGHTTPPTASPRVVSLPELFPGRPFLKQHPPQVVNELLREGAVILRDVVRDGQKASGLIRALVLFEKDADAVFRLLIQTHRQDEYLPLLQSAKTIERYGSGNLDQHELEVLFLDVIFRVRHRWDARERTITWSLDPAFDNDLRRMEGSWKIYPLEVERSIGEYTSRVDLGRLVPDFVEQMLSRRELPEALHAQRAWVNSGGS